MPEFNFDLKKSQIFRAVKWGRYPFFSLAKPAKELLLVLYVFSLSAFLFGFLAESFSQETLRILLGASALASVPFCVFLLLENFFDLKLKNPKLKARIEEAILNPGDYNLAEFLDYDSAKAVFGAIQFSKRKGLNQVPLEALLYFSLEKSPEINFIFSRALLDFKGIKKWLKVYIKELKGVKFSGALSPDSQKAITDALVIAQRRGHKTIGISDLFISQIQIDQTTKKYFIQANIKARDIENLAGWVESLLKRIEERKKFWEWKNLIKKSSLAKDWASGYTLTLDRFSIDITEVVKKQGFPEIIGHRREIESMERVLSRRDINNVLLVGEPGSGRRSMVYALATKSVLGESLPHVNYKRVLQLDLTTILAQTETREEAEAILDEIFREQITAGNIILVIDDFHNFIGGNFNGAKSGAMDIGGSLAPYLSSPAFQIVALASFEGLHKNIEQNSSILSLFEKVEVSEISKEETLFLLGNLALTLERKYKKFVSYQALRDIIDLSEKYLPANTFPEKALGLLDEIMVYVSRTRDKVVLSKHVAKIISEKTQIPIGDMEEKEREILLNLEDLIHQRIINQEEAIKEVSSALQRARTEIAIRKGPMGSFLFLGPTGVGKTETSKALAEIYFGSGQRDKSLFPPRPDAAGLGEERMIRLDMSEFQDIKDISRLLGSLGQEGLLTTPVRESPFSLLLLDEIEKAHPNILNLFLQVLDEGRITDGLGRGVDFKSTIIIATSNAAYQIILEAVKEGAEWSGVKEKLLNYVFEKGIFRPEFINRFDAVVVFGPLSKENLLKIAELMLKKLKKNLAEKEIEFIITEPLKEKIVELGFDPTFGARQMQRVIQDKVGNVLAKAILSGELKRGSRVEVGAEKFDLKISS